MIAVLLLGEALRTLGGQRDRPRHSPVGAYVSINSSGRSRRGEAQAPGSLGSVNEPEVLRRRRQPPPAVDAAGVASSRWP